MVGSEGIAVSCLSVLDPGEASGDSEGNDSRVLAESGVTRDCFRVRILALSDL